MEERPGDDRPQLPQPSLWPVGFAVGIVCLLVGLIVSWWVAAAGAVLALVFGFLWAREVATGHPPVPGPPPDEAAPDAPAVPANEGEAAMPEPQPGERFPRSRFLEGATLGLGALIGVVVTLPAAGFALLPGFLKQKGHKVDLGPIKDFEENKWQVVTFARDPTHADISRRTAFVRNNGLLDGVPSFTIISNRCAHVGCPVQPGGPVFQKEEKTIKTANGEVLMTPVLPAAGFICPCHGGSYDQEGNRIAGPPVRGLDRYEFDIVNGRLILGDLYSVVKVEGSGKTAKIEKVDLHGPGQHADGPESWLYPLDWLEERSGLVGGVRYFLFRKVPGDTSWWHTLGSATLTAFLVQLVTGVILAMYYKPSPAEAHSSVEHITHDLTLGWLVRGMHRWGASVFIILMFMHMGRVFLFGAYKYPRELNWIVGVLLLATGLFEGLTGYLLPFDQTAYWATVVAVNINGTAPFVGPYLATVLRGGAEIGPDTLSRFYSIHMLLVPGALMGLIGLHLYLIVRLGVTSPPWSKDAAGREPEEAAPPARSGLVQPGPRAAGVRRRPTE